MLRMIKAEWYKMIKSRGFKVLCIVAILFGLLNTSISIMMSKDFVKESLGTQMSEEQMEELLGKQSDQIVSPGSLGFHTSGAKDPFKVTGYEAFHFAFGSGVMEILIAVLVGTMVAKEYSEGTIKNTLAYGKKRSTFYLAKFTNIVAGSAVIMALQVGVTTIGFTMTGGWGGKFHMSQLTNMIGVFLGAVVVFGAVAALMMLISTLVKSNGATIGIAVVLFILLPIMTSFLYGVYDWLDKIYELTLFYNSALVTALKATSGDILKAVAVGLVTMAIALVVGVNTFKIQDIK